MTSIPFHLPVSSLCSPPSRLLSLPLERRLTNLLSDILLRRQLCYHLLLVTRLLRRCVHLRRAHVISLRLVLPDTLLLTLTAHNHTLTNGALLRLRHSLEQLLSASRGCSEDTVVLGLDVCVAATAAGGLVVLRLGQSVTQEFQVVRQADGREKLGFGVWKLLGGGLLLLGGSRLVLGVKNNEVCWVFLR